jgi:glutaredoxin-related protein
MSDVQQRIDQLVKNNRVVLFMKGTAQFPMCGFSGRAIQVLKACGVNDLKTVNVLEDDSAALRERRVRGRLGHHDGDVPGRRTAASARREGLTP